MKISSKAYRLENSQLLVKLLLAFILVLSSYLFIATTIGCILPMVVLSLIVLAYTAYICVKLFRFYGKKNNNYLSFYLLFWSFLVLLVSAGSHSIDHYFQHTEMIHEIGNIGYLIFSIFALSALYLQMKNYELFRYQYKTHIILLIILLILYFLISWYFYQPGDNLIQYILRTMFRASEILLVLFLYFIIRMILNLKGGLLSISWMYVFAGFILFAAIGILESVMRNQGINIAEVFILMRVLGALSIIYGFQTLYIYLNDVKNKLLKNRKVI